MRVVSSSRLIGLTRKSSAPSSIALSLSLCSESAVITMIGMNCVRLSRLMRWQISKPGDPRHHEVEQDRGRAAAAGSSAAPPRRRRRSPRWYGKGFSWELSRSTTDGLSSTMRIRGFRVMMPLIGRARARCPPRLPAMAGKKRVDRRRCEWEWKPLEGDHVQTDQVAFVAGDHRGDLLRGHGGKNHGKTIDEHLTPILGEGTVTNAMHDIRALVGRRAQGRRRGGLRGRHHRRAQAAGRPGEAGARRRARPCRWRPGQTALPAQCSRWPRPCSRTAGTALGEAAAGGDAGPDTRTSRTGGASGAARDGGPGTGAGTRARRTTAVILKT